MISTAMISATTPALAMEGGKLPLTIERMNASPALAGTSPRGLKLSPDGLRVTYLAGRKDNQSFMISGRWMSKAVSRACY